jgi:RNA polymerase sigma factor (sigma-70 family)
MPDNAQTGGFMDSVRVSTKSDGSLDIYFREIAKIRANGTAGSLVTGNLRLPVHFAALYRRNYGLSVDDMADLIQSGNIGLISAAKNYQNRGNSFSTYAACFVKSAILREIDNLRLIRLPENKQNEIRTLNVAIGQLEQKGQGKPGEAAIAAYLGWEPKKVRELLGMKETTLPLDVPTRSGRDGEEDTLMDTEDSRFDPALRLC